ncbi:MAG: S-layer homology domain-containing protein, partial [Candidatus Peribacteraceae bacterium]|nr:S-layer homology domain-containing protein [Candidatus Peribacteraceae bacterium]
KIAVQSAGIDSTACTGSLVNASAQGRWSAPFITCTETRGWAVFSDGSVPVERSATRAEVVSTLLQAFAVPLDPRAGGVFRDVDGSTEFAAAVETAAGDQIISGYTDPDGNPTGLFGPTDSVNRAEVAKMVSLALQVYR